MVLTGETCDSRGSRGRGGELRVVSRRDDARSVAPFWARHPVALPVGVGLLTLTLLSGLALIAGQRSDQSIQSAAQGRVRTERDATVRVLVRQTDDYKRAAATLAANSPVIDALRSGNRSAVTETASELSTLARSKDSPAAFVSDLRGRLVVFYPAQPELIGQNFSFRDWFKGVSATGRPYVSSGYRSARAGHPLVVAVATPVFDGSRRVGYVTVLWQLDSVREVSVGARQDNGVFITITDQLGQSLLAALTVDNRGQPVEPKVSGSTRSALAGRKVSSVVAGNLEEAGPVPGLGWTVTAAMPTKAALLPAVAFRQRQEINLGVALLMVVLATAMFVRLARRRTAEHEIVAAERRKLRISEESFKRVFDEGLTGEILSNTDGEILRVNEAMAVILGREPSSLLGRPLVSCFADDADKRTILELVRGGESELRGEMAIRDDDDRDRWGVVAMTWVSEHDERKVLLVQVEDITARRAAEKHLTELTLHDELTGLPNRRLLLERCEQAFARARSRRADGSSVAALFVDLDGFKLVNDRAGHDKGDLILRSIAMDLQEALRPTDTVARIGGDEFVVLLEQGEGLEYLRTVSDRIRTAIRRQVTADGASFTVSASVGIARVDLADEPNVGPDQLLARADAAMYRAKERGRDRHDVFDADLRGRTEARKTLEQAMRNGLRDDRVSMVFLPVIDIDRNIVVGAEALMRLRDSTGRLLPTGPAIIAAEAAGLAEVLSDRVLNLALEAACTWPQDMSIAVNISARELTGEAFRIRIENALFRHNFDPARFVLEITETSIMSAGPSALAELKRLREQGVRIALDDFGTAYATLENLTTLPVDALKVDTSFTAGLPDRRTHSAVVHGIASMAHELDIPCIVEGVETKAQLEALQGMAVQAQGWLWGKPQGPDHVPAINVVLL